MTARRVVFMDRDGTINEEVSFLADPDRLALIPGSAEAIAALNRARIAVVVVSNQSGVARGYFDLAAVERVNRALSRALAAFDAHVDGYYVCPHHPDLDGPCRCRKPGTLLLERASVEHELVREGSMMVGDRLSDIGAGVAFGVRTALVLTGYGRDASRELDAAGLRPDRVVDDLRAAVSWYLGRDV